jgi:hypothetical protein
MTTIEEMLAEILARLEEMNAQWHSAAEQLSSPSSPPSTSIFTADAGSSSPSSASPTSTRVAASEYSLIAIFDSETEAEPTATSLISSPTSAPRQATDHDFLSGVDRLSRLASTRHRLSPPPSRKPRAWRCSPVAGAPSGALHRSLSTTPTTSSSTSTRSASTASSPSHLTGCWSRPACNSRVMPACRASPARSSPSATSTTRRPPRSCSPTTTSASSYPSPAQTTASASSPSPPATWRRPPRPC